MRLRFGRGRVIYGPTSICELRVLLHLLLLPPLGGPTCCLRHRYGPGHKAICLPSTYLRDLRPFVGSTLYLSGTRAGARIDSVGSWPDLRLVLCSLYYLHTEGKCCRNPSLSDEDCKRRSFELAPA